MKITRSGFTLVEVLVSSIVIAMMMMSILGFVAYASEVWQRTHFATTLASEGQMLLDTFDREMSFASAIISPNVGAPATSTIIYKRTVFDYNRANSTASCSFRIEKHPTERRVYSKYNEGTLDTLWTVANDPANVAKQLARSRHNYDLGRHVDTLEITRVSANRVDVRVVLKSRRLDDEFETENEYFRSVLVPNPGP
ncbi:MAG: prepilin-type N-terminal cleavage/methylation domain-containing protein [Candidatus Riflebacteria bacterium]|nr:prepilin-type N-terminal cleavage/methylation domain-containing protein [Candidatus Riflebacteria bacterium]